MAKVCMGVAPSPQNLATFLKHVSVPAEVYVVTLHHLRGGFEIPVHRFLCMLERLKFLMGLHRKSDIFNWIFPKNCLVFPFWEEPMTNPLFFFTKWKFPTFAENGLFLNKNLDFAHLHQYHI